MPVNKTTIQRRGRPTTVGQGKPSRTGHALVLPLTEKQARFILAWLVRRNSTRAYQDSYPKASYETCRVEGSRLFRDPRISCHIGGLLKEEAKRLESKARKVTDALAGMAFTVISDLYTKDGTIIAPANLPRDVAIAVRKVKRREILGPPDDAGERQVVGNTVEVEMVDKLQPLRLLGLELGMFGEKVEHAADDAIIQALREGRARSLAG
jgi:phage terminase small subunit